MKRALMSIAESAALLGVSTATAYRMEAAGQLPTIQLGDHGSKRVIRSKLIEIYGIEDDQADVEASS